MMDRMLQQTMLWLFCFAVHLSVPCSAAEADDAIDEPAVTSLDRDHWSWRPLQKPSLPAIVDSEWCENAIDRFVLASLEANGLMPAPEASPDVLVRRLYLDLTGLPPTRQQIDRFVLDKRPDAYDRLVDRLMQSDDYGRHAAQSWLDLARFAETDGFEHDKTRPGAWRYRDWVIDSINDDPGYDRFVRSQIAGDVTDPKEAVATAFCLAGPDMPDINLQEERRDFLLNDITATVGAVFLAIQSGCAQCHDHKYDPISQADYYRLRAVFDPDVQVVKNKTVDVLSASSDTPGPCHLMIRGDWRRPGPTVAAAFPRIANPMSAAVPVDADGAQRRRALADWLTRGDHPLTARVMANRLWQYRFGRGLSDTPNDFGVMGSEPTPDGLLDWLAVEFIEHRWSRKHIDRLIVSSATYRQSSVCTAPEKQNESWLWDHHPRRRLSGEQLRDAMLLVSGQLSRVSGGPSVMPPLPNEMLSTIRADHWKTSNREEQHGRRSIYIFSRRNLRYPIFDVFDRPSGLASCAVRNESTTAIQSLTMLNSQFSARVAQAAVDRAIASSRSPSDAVVNLARMILPHAPQMISAVLPMAQTRLSELAGSERRQREHLEDLAVAMLNSNAFLYAD